VRVSAITDCRADADADGSPRDAPLRPAGRRAVRLPFTKLPQPALALSVDLARRFPYTATRCRTCELPLLDKTVVSRQMTR